MTLGPDPITQINRRSRRLGECAHLLYPALEQRPCIVRARARLGVELDRAGTQARKLEPFDRAVVEGDVSCLAIRARPHREAVVLRRYEHAVGRPLEHGVIGTAVPEWKLEGLVARRQRQELVPEANAEHGDAPEERSDRFDLGLERLRVAGTIGE